MTYAPYMVVIVGMNAVLIQGLSIMGVPQSLTVMVNPDEAEETMEAEDRSEAEAEEETIITIFTKVQTMVSQEEEEMLIKATN